jgi:hypothetical protein
VGSQATHRRRLARRRERLSTLKLDVVGAAGRARGCDAVLDDLIGIHFEEELERMVFPAPEPTAS